MNLLFRDEEAFWAEYQNEPMDTSEENTRELTFDEILARGNKLKRRRVPDECSHLTAFIDVSEKVLWWMVCAWGDGFTGAIVDFGVWPDQKTNYVTLRSVKKSMKQLHPGSGFEAALLKSLEELSTEILDREYHNESGTAMNVDRCLIDANWGQSTEIIYQFCRRSQWKNILYPSHGVGITATKKPLVDPTTKKRRGETRGDQWIIAKGRGQMKLRFDTNYWKTHVANRLSVAVGDPGALTLFEDRPSVLRMLAEQLTSEKSVTVEAAERKVDQWELKKPGLDNHFWDALTGCAVAASIEGVAIKEKPSTAGRRGRSVVRLSELGA